MTELYYYARVTSTKFVVKNIIPYNKTIKIFNYPVMSGQTRDLLMIPGVSEEDIRYSLLKGDLYLRLMYKEIYIVESNIDLLQFNDDQRQFLELGGVTVGLTITDDNLDLLRLDDIALSGAVDGINTIYTIPSGHFIYDATHRIYVYRNGVRQSFLDDFIIAESSGPGSGYDTVIFTQPPLSIPLPVDVITADYYIKNDL